LSRDKTKKEVEGDTIIINELLVPEEAMVEAKTHVKTKVRGSHTPLSRS